MVDDPRWMDRALELAANGAGLVSPNPLVGAVLVRGGEVIGEGSYTYDGRKHAEVQAIEQAAANTSDAARGATLFINLEPCCHHGRTGPCTEAVIAAGISRVVAAMADPNPLVSGRGFERLRGAGVEVELGRRREEAERINEAFAKHIRSGLPFVTLKAALTLDGKIAAPGDNSGWITCEQARAFVQRQRHAHDALITGIGTILADDPLLTDRSGRPRRRPLLRVVMDSHLRLPLESRILHTINNDLLVYCGASAESGKRAELERRGAAVRRLQDSGGRPDLREVLTDLGNRQITGVLLEAGAELNAAALENDLVDKVFLYYAPKILGGRDSLSLAGGRGIQDMRDALQVRNIRLHNFGCDFAVEGYLHEICAEEAGAAAE